MYINIYFMLRGQIGLNKSSPTQPISRRLLPPSASSLTSSMPPNLRSRQVEASPSPGKSTPRNSARKKRATTFTPATVSAVRRSRRLVSKGLGASSSAPPTMKRQMISSEFGDGSGEGSPEVLVDEVVSDSESKESGGGANERENVVELVAEPVDEAKTGKKRKSGEILGSQGEEFGPEDLYLSLRSGSRIEKRVSVERVDYKGKEILIINSDDEDEISKVEDSDGRNLMTGLGKFSREEKGKRVIIDCDSSPNDDESVDLELKLGVPDLDLKKADWKVARILVDLGSDQAPLEVNDDGGASRFPLEAEIAVARQDGHIFNDMLEQRLRFNKERAKKSAPRFARASSIDLVGNDVDSDPEGEVVQEQAEQGEVEDWPGPFSTAMNIIRDRQNKGSAQAQNLCVDNAGASKVIWNPSIDQVHEQKTRVAPSLQDLCMEVLVKNSDEITSLEYVPDALVHKLVSMLCDSRKMTTDVLDLLFQGSPSEICITDCSWIEEEQFKKSFEPCNTENLMVLQLDQCGRCMPDYVVLATLAHKGLPILTTLSLKGACRLSDDGLKALISSAPALKSLNLSQCSLITDTGIKAISDSVSSGLRELYLDDCQGLNVMLLLPALERLMNLEVLSLVGIPSVSDQFLKQLMGSIGQNIKELALADCVKLTDSSLKVISKNCSQLCALDLINVTKLTDNGIGYLANCCQAIQTLKLCRNRFSDEAVAAFLEACGESLKELSLNNVSQVGPHTSISISRRCKNLVSLDVSWCRSLTDECLGLIADSCQSLRVLKLFGCTQITSRFWAGHTNQDLHVTGLKLTPILENLKKRDLMRGPLRYSAVIPS